MKINGFGPGSVSGRSGPNRSAATEGPVGAEEIRVNAVDRAEISSEALDLAQAALEAEAAEAGLEPERLQVIHDRIGSGFYGQPEVVEEVAGRLLASGDL